MPNLSNTGEYLFKYFCCTLYLLNITMLLTDFMTGALCGQAHAKDYVFMSKRGKTLSRQCHRTGLVQRATDWLTITSPRSGSLICFQDYDLLHDLLYHHLAHLSPMLRDWTCACSTEQLRRSLAFSVSVATMIPVGFHWLYVEKVKDQCATLRASSLRDAI